MSKVITVFESEWDKLEAALEAIYKDGVWDECEYCARKVVIADEAIHPVQTRQADKVRWEYEQGLDGPEHDPADSRQADQRDYKTLYDELIMEVAKKYPDESRHETAKRYIHERENQPNRCASASTEREPQS